ncbi:hexokinase-domain-containing protein [Lipomyces tetrasporus]
MAGSPQVGPVPGRRTLHASYEVVGRVESGDVTVPTGAANSRVSSSRRAFLATGAIVAIAVAVALQAHIPYALTLHRELSTSASLSSSLTATLSVFSPLFARLLRLNQAPLAHANFTNMTTSSLLEEAASISKQFDVSKDRLIAISNEFIRLTDLGLKSDGMPMAMIPSFVTGVPNGTEKGTFLAVDLGGTNFRVCSIHLNGDGTFDLLQTKSVIPRSLMVGTSKELFSFLAKKVDEFIKTHLDEKFNEEGGHAANEHIYKLGFTFSFPVNQTAINSGTLIRWTKGFDVADAVGKDVCQLLQDELNLLKLPVHVAALVNDTVGTLMSRSYSSPGEAATLVGVILGTGTNGAYAESLAAVEKLDKSASALADKSIMVINTEWGSFDNNMKVLPTTTWDDAVDLETPNPGYQMFEKRVSGMFLGEILRRILLELYEKGHMFSKASTPLTTAWSLDTSILSRVEADTTPDLVAVKSIVETDLGLPTTLIERQAIKVIVEGVGKRSALLAGAVIGGILVHTKACQSNPVVDIGVDGSVFEFYPGYEDLMREALKDVLGENEKKVRIGIAKDGSGVGAALCALVA